MTEKNPAPFRRRMPWHSGIGGRVVITFCTLSLLVLMAVQLSELYGLPFGVTKGRVADSTARELTVLSSIADGNKKLITSWLEERHSDTLALASAPGARSLAVRMLGTGERPAAPALDEWLEVVRSAYRYEAIRIVDPETGAVLSESAGDLPNPPLNPALLAEASRPGNDESMSFLPDGSGRSARLHLIRQIGQDLTPDERPVLLLDCSIDLDQVVKPLLESSIAGVLGRSGEVVMVDGKRRFLMTTRHAMPGGTQAVPLVTVDGGKAARLATEGSEGALRTLDYRGVPVLAAFRHIPLNPEVSWGMVVKIDEAEAMAPVRRQLKRALVFSALGIAVTLCCALVVARLLGRPLERIARTAAEIEGGDLALRVPLEGSRETIELAYSFNAMVDRLKQSQEGLEQRVVERTLQLEALNRELQQEITGRARVEERLRESNEKFAAAWDSAPVMISLTSLDDWRFLDVNNKFCTTSAFSREEALGKTAVEIGWIRPEDASLIREKLAREGRIQDLEITCRTKSGEPLLCRRWGEVITLAGRRVLLSIVMDITQYRKVEEQFHQAQKMESVGRLAGGVAHDFNNMLSVILGHAELCLMDPEQSPTQRRHLEAIRDAGARSAEITKQLLAFARRQIAEPKVLDLNVTVAGMLRMLERLIGEGIELVWTPGADACRVRIDPAQVDQMLANLCVNARDAIAGIGRLTIRTENVVLSEAECRGKGDLAPGAYVLLSVSDTGEGIDEALLEHIFEPFFTTKEMGKGTGLGLATVFGIVKQNQGVIRVESSRGEGTTFSILLPAVTSGASEEQEVRAAAPIQGGAETILLVEDEPTVIEMSRTILENLGYRLLVATDPEEALRLVGEGRGSVDLLLTDVVMPGMNGRELAQRLQELRPGLKCLFMSGYTADIIADHGVLHDSVNFLQKPFDVRSLAAKVRSVLSGAAS